MWALSTCGEPDEIKKNTHPKNITALFREQEMGVLIEGAPREHAAKITQLLGAIRASPLHRLVEDAMAEFRQPADGRPSRGAAEVADGTGTGAETTAAAAATAASPTPVPASESGPGCQQGCCGAGGGADPTPGDTERQSSAAKRQRVGDVAVAPEPVSYAS